MKQYFMVTMRVRDQMIMETAPTRSSWEGWEEKVEEKT